MRLTYNRMSIPENKHTSSLSVLDLITTFCFVDLLEIGKP